MIIIITIIIIIMFFCFTKVIEPSRSILSILKIVIFLYLRFPIDSLWNHYSDSSSYYFYYYHYWIQLSPVVVLPWNLHRHEARAQDAAKAEKAWRSKAPWAKEEARISPWDFAMTCLGKA